MSDIQTLMRSANPIEDAHTEFGQDDLDALLLLTQQRSGDMDVKDVTTPVTPDEKTNRGWLVAVAAFAVVITVLGVALLFNRSGSEVPPATTPTTEVAPPTTQAEAESVAVAEPSLTDQELATIDAFVQAVNSGDRTALEALHDPGFVVEGFPGEGWNSPLAVWVELHEKQYEQRSVIALDCVEAAGAASCRKSIDGPIPNALWYQPMSTSVVIRMNDGVIVGATWRCSTCMLTETPQEQTKKLRLWIESVDPEIAALLPSLTTDDATPEINALWADWAAAWVEAGRP